MNTSDISDKQLNICNGYLYFCDFTHPLANKSGIVYVHRHLMSVSIGRWITKEECVHHKDGNRANNDIANLEILSLSEHSHLHNGYRKMKVCKECGTLFVPSAKTHVYCSNDCYKLQHRKFEIEREELNDLVWKMPTTEVAKLFSVSDKAIEKRCKLLNISKPPRGYWNKVKAGA